MDKVVARKLRPWEGRMLHRRTFLSFLQWMRRRYRDGRTLHVVMDDVSYHLTLDVRAFAAASRIKFYLTP
ncbi:MAG: hypothetical protein ACYSUF_09810 [Planctomycetota bacterium]|jgi:hypothetical protein